MRKSRKYIHFIILAITLLFYNISVNGELSLSASDNSCKKANVLAQDYISEANPELTTDDWNDSLVAALPAGVKDGINYIDTSTVIFSLLAPHKKYVYLIGDFTNWETLPEFQMYRTPDSTRYWIKIDSLKKGKEYRFQYFVDGSIKVGDPYSDKILDPVFDNSIPATTYPGLIPYPTGKTENSVSVVQTGQEPYSWQVKNFVPPAKEKMIVYELSIRDMVETHMYTTIKDTLDYIQNLGINVVELMPVTEFGGNDGWGYNPNFYFAPDKYFGTKNDLKALVDECHKRGMAVVLDMVLNHSWGENPLLKLYWNDTTNWPAKDNPWFFPGPMFANPQATYGPVFNHGSVYTQNFVDRVNAYWLTEYKFDGFRFDFTKGFVTTYKDASDPWGDKYDPDRIAILKRMADSIWQVNPNALVILEHLVFGYTEEEKELADYGMLLWGNFNYQFTELSKGNDQQLSWMSYKNRNWNAPNVITYPESHDWERVIVSELKDGRYNTTYDTRDLNTALDRMKLNASFIFTMPGPHMIWLFDELGYDVSVNFNGYGNLKPYHWEYFQDPARKKLYDVYAALIHLKQNYSVFATDNFGYSTDNILKSFHLNSDSMNVTIIGNFDIIDHVIDPAFQHDGEWYDFFTGKALSVINIHKPLALKPGEFHIFIDKTVDFPEPGLVPFSLSGLTSKNDTYNNPNIKVFPNPSGGIFRMEFPNNFPVSGASIHVSDLLGKNIYEMPLVSSQATVDLSPYPNGMYFIQVEGNIETFSLPVIKN